MHPVKVTLLLSYISVASGSAAMITPALPTIEHTWHLAASQTEWLVSIFMLGYLIGQMLYGTLANRMGRLGALRTGLIVNLVGVAMCLIASGCGSYLGLLLGRFVSALGASAGLSCTFMLLNESLPEQCARHAMSFAAVSFVLSIGLATFVGGIVTHLGHWNAMFWILGVYGVVMLASTCLFTETLTMPVAMSWRSIVRQYRQGFGSRSLCIYALFVGLVTLATYCYSAAAPGIAAQFLQINAAQYGTANFSNMAGMLIGAFVAASLLKRTQGLWLLPVGAMGIVLCMVLIGLWHWLHALTAVRFFALTTVMYFITSFLFPVGSHRASNAIACKASASSAMNIINMGSGMVGVTVMGSLPFGQVYDLVGITVVFALLCLGLLPFAISAAKVGSVS